MTPTQGSSSTFAVIMKNCFPKLDEDLFPKLDEVCRTTLTRQAANLWSIKLWSIKHMLRRRPLKRLWK